MHISYVYFCNVHHLSIFSGFIRIPEPWLTIPSPPGPRQNKARDTLSLMTRPPFSGTNPALRFRTFKRHCMNDSKLLAIKPLVMIKHSLFQPLTIINHYSLYHSLYHDPYTINHQVALSPNISGVSQESRELKTWPRCFTAPSSRTSGSRHDN